MILWFGGTKSLENAHLLTKVLRSLLWLCITTDCLTTFLPVCALLLFFVVGFNKMRPRSIRCSSMLIYKSRFLLKLLPPVTFFLLIIYFVFVELYLLLFWGHVFCVCVCVYVKDCTCKLSVIVLRHVTKWCQCSFCPQRIVASLDIDNIC